MINPLKLMKLKQEAEKIQKELEKQEFTTEKGRIKVVITGNQIVRSVQIDGQDVPELTEVVNDAIRQSQQAAASRLADISKEMGLGG